MSGVSTQPKGEKPILFSGPMVQAILAGRKTQTRRVVKPQPEGWDRIRCEWYCPTKVNRHGDEVPGAEVFGFADEESGWPCPYGGPGGKLWVREKWRKHPEVFFEGPGGCLYAADRGHEHDGPWKPSIHMPRWASRITLEVLEVRVERLQEISEEDAKAEGCTPHVNGKWWQGYHKDEPLLHQKVPDDGSNTPPDWLIEAKPYRDLSHMDRTAKMEFSLLWDSINGEREEGAFAWNKNPWVWVVSFKRLEVSAERRAA